MSNPTRQEIIEAHESLAVLIRFASLRAESHDERDQILAWDTAIGTILPSLPRPTMAEVEWDDDKHYLAEAEHAIWGKVIMLFRDVDEGNIFVKTQSKENQHFLYGTPEYLTPTGKRYTLAAADQPEGKA